MTSEAIISPGRRLSSAAYDKVETTDSIILADETSLREFDEYYTENTVKKPNNVRDMCTTPAISKVQATSISNYYTPKQKLFNDLE
jgi:hypothetical protein